MTPKKLDYWLVPLAVVAYGLWLAFGSYSFLDPIQIAKFAIVSLCFWFAVVALISIRAHPPARWSSTIRRLREERPCLFRILLATFVTVALIGVLEAVFLALGRAQASDPSIVRSDNSIYACDSLLGYRLKPNSTGRYTKSNSSTDEVIYSVVYTIDDVGNRVVPRIASGRPSHTAFFLGCSFVFGEGLEDDETLPCFFSGAAPEFHAVNRGRGGAGTNHVLAALEEGQLEPADLARDAPIGFYLFIDEHVERNIGSMFVANGFGARAPHYVTDHSDGVVREGDFLMNRPWRSVAYWLLSKSATLRYFGFDWPMSVDDGDLELTARIIAGARDAFDSVTNGGQFVVVIFPGSLRAGHLTQLLSDRGVTFLDYSGIFERPDPRFHIKDDGHPNAAANRAIAAKLAEDARALVE